MPLNELQRSTLVQNVQEVVDVRDEKVEVYDVLLVVGSHKVNLDTIYDHICQVVESEPQVPVTSTVHVQVSIKAVANLGRVSFMEQLARSNVDVEKEIGSREANDMVNALGNLVENRELKVDVPLAKARQVVIKPT